MESIKIGGMSCNHCVGSVEKALNAIPELSQVTVNLDAGEATFENQGADRQLIKEAIAKIGFEPGD